MTLIFSYVDSLEGNVLKHNNAAQKQRKQLFLIRRKPISEILEAVEAELKGEQEKYFTNKYIIVEPNKSVSSNTIIKF